MNCINIRDVSFGVSDMGHFESFYKSVWIVWLDNSWIFFIFFNFF